VQKAAIVIVLALVSLAAVIAVIAAIFILGSRAAALDHARFTEADVEAALAEVVSPHSEYHDAWDLFLSWPIGEPYLESVRQRCLAIVKDDDPPRGRDISYGAERQIKALLEELRRRRPA
jgi:hypothetical protein